MIYSRNRIKLVAIALALTLFTPVFAAAQVSFVKNLNDALTQAAKENKFIILDISATW